MILPYILPAIVILLIISHIVDKIISNKSKRKEEEHYPFDEKDLY